MTVIKSLPFEKPTLVKTIAILTLVNGIVNIFWGLAASSAILSTVVLACLVVFTILPTVLGVFETIYAAKLLAEPMQPIRPSQTIAIFEILCLLTGNIFSMIVGILSLVFYNDPVVRDYFTRLSDAVPSTPIPATLPKPPATPAVPSPVQTTSPAKETTLDTPVVPEVKRPPQRKAVSNETGETPKGQKPKRTQKREVHPLDFYSSPP